jgi:hypothetical protein
MEGRNCRSFARTDSATFSFSLLPIAGRPTWCIRIMVHRAHLLGLTVCNQKMLRGWQFGTAASKATSGSVRLRPQSMFAARPLHSSKRTCRATLAMSKNGRRVAPRLYAREQGGVRSQQRSWSGCARISAHDQKVTARQLDDGESESECKVCGVGWRQALNATRREQAPFHVLSD